MKKLEMSSDIAKILYCSVSCVVKHGKIDCLRIFEFGEYEFVEPDGKYFTLEELQECVGGLIEFVYLKNDYVMVLNEEGKINGKCVPNLQATKLYHNSHETDDVIYGNVLICKNKYLD